tara:strand:- start:97 stop:396 length:300 start_codon:yes stop_codon:yes gene_type:complete
MKHTLSNASKKLYNVLIDLSWDNHQITQEHVIAVTKLRRSQLAKLTAELIEANKALLGNEESDTGIIECITPIVKGGAYVYPYFDFKHDEWQGFKLEIS